MSGSATNVIQAPKLELRIMRYELSVAMERGLLQRGAMPRFSLNDDGIVVRARLKLLKRINVICPTGARSKILSSPFCKNISLHPSGKSSLQIRAIPPHTEGRIAIVTNAGWGAVDAAAFCARWGRRASRKTLERSPAC